MEFSLIDAIAPFFRGLPVKRINWSKIPFHHLVTEGENKAIYWEQVRSDMRLFAKRVAKIGYRAVTLDDVAHLIDHPHYEPPVRSAIQFFQTEFRKLFTILLGEGLQIYITADYFTSTPAIEAHLQERGIEPAHWFRDQLKQFLAEFPEVSGVVLRIGESDGHDVRDPIRSQLILRTAHQVNHLLRTILPIFEQADKILIFRTWTVGAYPVGDLIWHPKRMRQALEGIDSTALIVSMKYGESDFFRYLSLNPQFAAVKQAKLIEFQARPEYEGAGEYPSFIGWQCEAYARELRTVENVVGFSVWCQTGGWHGFRRLAFLDKDALWVELNVFVLKKIMIEGYTADTAIEAYFGKEKAPEARAFLQLSEQVIERIFYIESFARQTLYFRRVRIPPLLHVFWDCIFINAATRKIMRHFTPDAASELARGEAAFELFKPMLQQAKTLGLPAEDIRFMRDTFHILLLARRYYFSPSSNDIEKEILKAKQAYKKRWPRSKRQRYRIRATFDPIEMNPQLSGVAAKLLIRRKRNYRWLLDHVFTLHLLAYGYRWFKTHRSHSIPKFVRKTAMGIDALFR